MGCNPTGPSAHWISDQGSFSPGRLDWVLFSLIGLPGLGRVEAEDLPEPFVPFLWAETFPAERFPHLGVLRPAAEMFHGLLLRLLAFLGETGLFDLQAGGAVIAPAQFHHILAERAQHPQLVSNVSTMGS